MLQNPKKVSLTKWHCIPQRLNSMFFEKYFSKEPVAMEEKYLKKSTLAFEVYTCTLDILFFYQISKFVEDSGSFIL